MRLWIDDERVPPDTDWVWVKSSVDAIDWLEQTGRHFPLEEIAFDHDLGLSGMYDEQGRTHTTRPVMDWLIEHDVWPNRISIHSGNPVGHRALYRAALAHAPEATELVAKFK